MSVRVCDARDEVSRTSKPFSGAGWARGVRLADFVRRLFLVTAVLSLVVTVFSASKVSSGEMSVLRVDILNVCEDLACMVTK